MELLTVTAKLEGKNLPGVCVCGGGVGSAQSKNEGNRDDSFEGRGESTTSPRGREEKN